MQFKSRLTVLGLLAIFGITMASPALASGSDLPPTGVTLSNPQGGASGYGTASLSWDALPSGVTALTATTYDYTVYGGAKLGGVDTSINPSYAGPIPVSFLKNGRSFFVVLKATYSDGVTVVSDSSSVVAIPTAPDPSAPAQVGVSVSGNGYIGNVPGDNSHTGTAPLEQGSSVSWKVTWTNTGNNTETFTFANVSGQSYGMPAPYVPASWVTFSQSSVDVPAWQSVTVTVTVTVPAGATPGLYTGVALGAGTIPASGGGIQQAAGAGMREYVQVVQ